MKVGSLVVIKKVTIKGRPEVVAAIKWMHRDNEADVYTIREIHLKGPNCEGNCVMFEEGVIGMYEGKEIALDARYVREVAPPENDINQQIQKLLEQRKLQFA